MTAVLIAIGVTFVLLATIDAAPRIIRARADAYLLHNQSERAFGLEDVGLAVISAIRRTDPDLPLELVQRMADAILEDLEDGTLTIGAEDAGPA